MGKQRIAILGGGMGSLTTAFELTSRPNWDADYEITVYQTGWRLGGKGASGRNHKTHDRIEEHGLHILFGFYDNAFRIMREAYAELGRRCDQPLATWQEAFNPHDVIVMMEKLGEEYVPWEIRAPRNHRVPGGEPPHCSTPFEYLIRLLDHAIKRYLTTTESRFTTDDAAAATVADSVLALAMQACSGPHSVQKITLLLQRARRDVGCEFFFLELAHFLASTSPKPGRVVGLDPGERELIPWLLREFLHRLRTRLEAGWRELRRLYIELDFMLTIAIGLIADDVIKDPIDWFKIDDIDFKAWLAKHGASDMTLCSPLIAGVYDAIFSTDLKVAAGTMVHIILLMALEYKGSVLYKMQAGMGDTVFTPLYQVLERRGVKFEFFHTVTNLALSPDRNQIQCIEIGVQATLRDDVVKYDPLVEVKELMCWPNEPNFDQLKQGAKLKAEEIDLENFWSGWQNVTTKTLEAGRDFDICVLGISIGAFPFICKELIEHDPRWRRMVDAVTTCQTSALQLWFLEGVDPGWENTGYESPLVIPYVEPLDTWCCMNQLLDKERWPPQVGVRSLHYLCSRLPDNGEPVPPPSHHEYPIRQAKRVYDAAKHWLENDAVGLWPRTAVPGHSRQFNWQLLVDPRGGEGPQRLKYQYWHAVTSPSERYVISEPNNTSARLQPKDSGFSNLVLTGDWTLNAMSAGFLEATAISGIMAANAVDGYPRQIAYDWLPQREPEPPPAFIPRDGILIATPPVQMKTTLYTFLLEADVSAIRTMCDTYLNLGGETVYRPIVPWVCLYCSSSDTAPIINPIGWCPELDFGFWVPVVAGKMDGRRFVPERFQIFTPYLWVDSGVAMSGGREVYGFPKELGKLAMPDHIAKQPRFTVDTLVIPHYAPSSKVIEARILDVHRKDHSIWESLEHLWTDTATLFKTFEDIVKVYGLGRLAVDEGEQFLRFLRGAKPELPMVFLKQFPSASPSDACYQAIVEAPVQITSRVTGGRVPGDYEINLWSFDSHRIATHLGLRGQHDGNRTTLRALAQFWAKFDALVQPGKVVYERGTTR